LASPLIVTPSKPDSAIISRAAARIAALRASFSPSERALFLFSAKGISRLT
jgi:hypothetical protein